MYGPEIPQEYQPFYDRLAAQSPVVTEGAAASQRPYQDFFSAYERMQQMRQPQRTGPFDLAPDQSNALDRLAAFGAALAGTRRSDFGGAFGEALQAMRQAGTAQRQEERQNRQLDVEAAYRAAQEARQMAELEFARDPNNPLNQLRVAQARAEEARINLIRRQAANVGAGERADPVVGRERDDQGRLYNIHRSGSATLVGGEGGPTFVDRSNTPQARAYNDYLNRRAAFTARLAENPMTQGEAGRRALRQWEEDNPRPPNPYAAPGSQIQQPEQPQQPTGNRVRLQGID